MIDIGAGSSASGSPPAAPAGSGFRASPGKATVIHFAPVISSNVGSLTSHVSTFSGSGTPERTSGTIIRGQSCTVATPGSTCRLLSTRARSAFRSSGHTFGSVSAELALESGTFGGMPPSMPGVSAKLSSTLQGLPNCPKPASVRTWKSAEPIVVPFGTAVSPAQLNAGGMKNTLTGFSNTVPTPGGDPPTSSIDVVIETPQGEAVSSPTVHPSAPPSPVRPRWNWQSSGIGSGTCVPEAVNFWNIVTNCGDRFWTTFPAGAGSGPQAPLGSGGGPSPDTPPLESASANSAAARISDRDRRRDRPVDAGE